MILLVLAAIGYFGANIGEVYMRHLKFKDAVQREATFRGKRSIPEIRQRIRFLADSLGLPDEAGISLVKKSASEVFIESHYDATIYLPGLQHDLHFEVRVKGSL